MKVEIETHELMALCEMAKCFVDALGDEIETTSEFPDKKRQDDQRYLSVFVIWERADRLARGLSADMSPDDKSSLS